MEYCLSILYVAMDELGMIWCMDAFMERRYKDWKFWVTFTISMAFSFYLFNFIVSGITVLHILIAYAMFFIWSYLFFKVTSITLLVLVVLLYAIFLRLVMQYAEREYGIDNDTQTLAVKGSRSRPVDCLHPEEVEALFKVLPRCSTLEQVIVMGLLNTGMRRGELAGLTWEDIDFDHCTVHVDKSLLIVNKGYHLTTTKEDNVRDIDVAPEFMEYLKTYRDQWLAQKHRMGSAWQTCMDGKWESYRESLQKLRGKNFIVINDFGWPISPDHYGKIVDRVAEKAGIRKIHPHMFRHTFVSILLSNPDIGVATVAAEAGHAQPSTTLAIYTQVYHKRQDSIRSQMSETLYKRKTPER